MKDGDEITKPPVHKAEVIEKPEAGEENDWQPFFDYLQTERGHQLADRIVALVEDFKKTALKYAAARAVHELWLNVGLIGFTVVAASWLAYHDKLGTPIGILFGTLVGYAFGRKTS